MDIDCNELIIYALRSQLVCCLFDSVHYSSHIDVFQVAGNWFIYMLINFGLVVAHQRTVVELPIRSFDSPEYHIAKIVWQWCQYFQQNERFEAQLYSNTFLLSVLISWWEYYKHVSRCIIACIISTGKIACFNRSRTGQGRCNIISGNCKPFTDRCVYGAHLIFG